VANHGHDHLKVGFTFICNQCPSPLKLSVLITICCEEYLKSMNTKINFHLHCHIFMIFLL